MEHHRRDLPWRSCSHPSKLASDATPSIWRAFVSSILPGRVKRNTHWVFLDCPGVGNGPNTSRPSSSSGALHITVDDFVREGWQRKLDPDYDVMSTLQKLLGKADWAESLSYTMEQLV